MQKKYTQLKEVLAPIYDLEVTRGLLTWAQHTMMPPKGALAREAQAATLITVIHEKQTDSRQVLGAKLQNVPFCECRLRNFTLKVNCDNGLVFGSTPVRTKNQLGMPS